MVRCTRCSWGFSSIRMAGESDCPRCRIKDKVRAPLEAGSEKPPMSDLYEKMRRSDAGGTETALAAGDLPRAS
jgi:hypothetical protein